MPPRAGARSIPVRGSFTSPRPPPLRPRPPRRPPPPPPPASSTRRTRFTRCTSTPLALGATFPLLGLTDRAARARHDPHPVRPRSEAEKPSGAFFDHGDHGLRARQTQRFEALLDGVFECFSGEESGGRRGASSGVAPPPPRFVWTTRPARPVGAGIPDPNTSGPPLPPLRALSR